MIALLAGLYLFCCLVVVLHVLRAPRGTEDANGFRLCPAPRPVRHQPATEAAALLSERAF